MASSPAPFGFLPPGALSGLRRSVIDPETGNPVVTSAPSGEVVQRSAVLPIGRDDSGALTPAVPGLLTGMADAAAFPGQVARGEASIRGADGRISDEAVGRAFDLAGTAMTGSMPFGAPKGALRMFGGWNAETADHAALSKAHNLAGTGADRQAIWDQTGWFQGPDKRWRFEIPDDLSTVGTPKNAPPGYGQLHHDDFADAYPELWNRTQQSIREAPVASGRYEAQDGVIHAQGPTIKDQHGIALHELQHAIQGQEGFARGANPKSFTATDWEAAGAPASTGQTLADAHRDWAWDQYHRTAGEVEARNVQTRMNMTPEQRSARPPWLTQDVADADQIVRLNSGGPPGAGVGAAVLASRPGAQAAPTQGNSPMSAGPAPFGFSLSPEDIARLMRQQGADPRADMPVEDAAPVSFLTQHGPDGFVIPPAVRAMAPTGDPSALRPGEQAPAVAAAPVPTLEGAPARLAPPPQSLTGLPPSFSFPDPVAPRPTAPAPRVAARTPAPEEDDAPAPMTVPLPPQRPFGLGVPSQADMPAVGAVPAQGQAPTGAPAVPEKEGPGIGTILGRLGDAGIGDQMMAFGSGLMTKHGFGAGVGAGFDNMQRASKDRAVTDLAKADLSLKQRKIAQETSALGGNAAIIKRAFPTLSDAEAIAAGSNGGQVTEALKILRDPNHGRDNDPAIVKARAQAQAEGTAAGSKDDVQIVTRPDGSIAAVNKSQIGEPNASAVTTVAPATGGTRIWGSPGPDGQVVQAPPNTPAGTPGYYDEKGAPHVSLTQGTNQLPQKANAELDGAAVKAITESRAKAEGAVGTIAAINRQKEALDNGIVSGWGADWRTQARAAAAQIFGVNDKLLTQSQLFDQSATQKAAELAKAISQSGHTTNMDLQLGKTISSGDRSSVEAALRAGIEAQEILAKQVIDRHNGSVDRFATPETAQRAGFFKVEQPEIYQYKPAAPDRSAVETELRRRGMMR